MYRAGPENSINGIKANQYVPEFMNLADISSIFKNKGSRMDLKNDRGIFILTENT